MQLQEAAGDLFSGASGGNPARLHLGFHYPRSRLTRAACQDHQDEFMRAYGHLTRAIPVNIYAVADYDSVVDFGTYKQVLKSEVEYIEINPQEFGLRNVEGALLTGERHIVIDEARRFFSRALDGAVRFHQVADLNESGWDWTIDCTFCANDAESIDRYEPCVTGLVEGPVDRSVTIMDGPFPSLYVWNEEQGLSSLTSAKFTPLSKTCRTYAEAKSVLTEGNPEERVQQMMDDLARFWPEARDKYRIVGHRLSIRAMPRSGADARLVDVVRAGERLLRIRAGKIDAIFHAARRVRELMCSR